MTNLFTNIDLTINLARTTKDQISLYIGSDLSGNHRKSTLYVNERNISTMLEDAWKSIRTRKIIAMTVSFDEIDYYDSLTNIYETPIFTISKGQRKSKISHKEHGSIPKDWNISFNARFEDTRTKTPIFEVIRKILNSKFTPEIEKKLSKAIIPFLQKKERYCSVTL